MNLFASRGILDFFIFFRGGVFGMSLLPCLSRIIQFLQFIHEFLDIPK